PELAGEHLLVLSNATDALWHIVWPSDVTGRTVLRRMVIERGFPRRTAVTQLAAIYEPRPTGASVQSRVDRAFDVAPVTKEFFTTYADVFERVSKMITGIDDVEKLRLFCQTLFNRLMFVYFLQRKGWLSINGDHNYLQALRTDSKHTKDGNFYRDRLLILFFSALNNPDSRNLSRGVRAAVGDVPFLNGGLFEKGHIDTECPDASVPDSVFDLTQARAVSEALDDVTVVDPACGSGAYLVGMLHELIELQQLLYSEKLQRDADKLYDMKLHIIERNVYGGDIDEFATNIAML